MKTVRIYQWSMFPMERNPKLQRFGVQLVHLHSGGTENSHHKNNKKVIRKSEHDSIEIAKKWIDEYENLGYKIQLQSANDKLINN